MTVPSSVSFLDLITPHLELEAEFTAVLTAEPTMFDELSLAIRLKLSAPEGETVPEPVALPMAGASP